MTRDKPVFWGPVLAPWRLYCAAVLAVDKHMLMTPFIQRRTHMDYCQLDIRTGSGILKQSRDISEQRLGNVAFHFRWQPRMRPIRDNDKLMDSGRSIRLCVEKRR